MIGKIISHYKIIEKLGEGGMGVVYKAQDLKLDRSVAIKFLSPHLGKDEEEKKRFMHEAKAASALEHSNICNIHEIDEAEDGQMFIVMAFYEGETLRKRIDRGPLELEKSIDIAIQVANGLTKAHTKDIIHRDIKPANLLITNDDEVKILDFGLAKLSGSSKLTKEGTTLGTVAYMSPEQARGETVDHRSDIWSMGVVLYEMITGQKPFKGDYEQAVVYSIINETQDALTGLRTGVQMELERVVNKALAKDANERYQHMDELLVDLKRLKKNSDSSIPVKPVEYGKKESTKKRIRNIVIGSSIILLIAIILFLGNIIFFKKMPFIEPKPIVVISFKNQTGDKTYDYLQEAIPNLLITSLEQSKYLRVITWERMHDLLKQLGRENVDIIDKELGFELCRLEGVESIILGTFVKAGDIFATDVKVLDVQSKRLLESTSSKGEGVGSILQNQIDELSQAISRSVKISEQAPGGTQLRISDITTPSMEAYNYFLRGRDEYEKGYYDDARRFLEKAVELDSTFAVAHLYLARVYGNLRYVKKEEGAYEKAKALSEKATDKERLYIEAAYAGTVESDPEKQYRILKQMVNKYPKEKRVHYSLGSYYLSKIMYKEAIIVFNKALELDPEYGPAINLLAYTYSEMRKYDKAIEYFEKYASVSPGDANPFDSMGELYFKLGNLDKAIGKFKEALEVKPDFGSEPRIAYIYALKENYAETMKWLDHFIAMAPSPGIKAKGFCWRGIYHSLLGHFNQSLKDISKAKELMKSTENEYGAVVWAMVKGWIYFDRGEYGLCRSCFEEYHEFVKDYRYLYDYIGSIQMLAFVDVREGRIDSARSRMAETKSLILEQSEKEPYWATQPSFIGKSFRMEIMLAEGAFEDAIAVGEKTSPVEMVSMGIKELLSCNIPFLQDILAQAYYRNGELDKAIAEYERLVTFDPNSQDRRWINPKYHYLLAKLYEEKDWKDKAIEENKTFLGIWKNADEDLPELIDAKKRLVNLIGKK
jgi:serine/threonine protein kinase/cytochrome c-type biogenesis protein CcmH/NrfG